MRDAPIDISIATTFDGVGPRHFGAARPKAVPFVVGDFSGEVTTGASCNCRVITLTPHCTGTHTECVGHLTLDEVDVFRIAPLAPLRAVLTTVTPIPARDSVDQVIPSPADEDNLVTASALQGALATVTALRATALIVRTLPNDDLKRRMDYTTQVPPYFSLEAVEAAVQAGVEHLILDLPSLDRTHDEGHLAGHRAFFGLPALSRDASRATRANCTITELAFIPDELLDGPCEVQLQVAAIAGDAAPSRPIVYR